MALPNIEMNPPQAHPCSPSWTPLPTPPYHHSGLTQCTRPKHLVLCIEPGLATHFIHDIIHVSMPYFNHRHQFTMFVWESVFSWLAISKKADLCRHNSKWSDLFYSVTGCPGCTSAGSLNLGWLSLPSLLILPNSLTLPHILVPFLALIQFLTCTGTEKTVWFSCFLHLLRLSGIWSDFRSQGSFQRSSDPHGLIPYLERQEKGISFEERV